MTAFTRTSPTIFGQLPAEISEIGGIVLDIVGESGVRIVMQIPAEDLVQDGFLGTLQVIGTTSGLTPELFESLGAGLAEVAVRMTVHDADTAPGESDEDHLSLLVGGLALGNLSDVVTEDTNDTGTSALATNYGFPGNTPTVASTGWFHVTDAGSLVDLYASVAASAKNEEPITVELTDDTPGDNTIDFVSGVDAGLASAGGTYEMDPSLLPTYGISDADIDEATGVASITITRTGDTQLAGAETLAIDFLDGTAWDQVDFAARQYLHFNFAANQTETTFQFDVLQDDLVEGPENFTIRVRNVDNGQTLASRTFTIQDDDAAPVAQDDYITTETFGTEFFVNEEDADRQGAPALATLANGNVAVAWQTSDTTQDGNGDAIKMRIFDPRGREVVGEFLVNAEATLNQRSPHLLALADGNVLAVWTTYRGTGDADVKARLFDPAGNPVTAEILVEASQADFAVAPDATQLDDGTILITWRDGYGYGNTNIGVRAYTPQLIPNSLVGNASGEHGTTNGSPAITSIQGGGTVIAWRDEGGDGDDIHAIFLDSLYADIPAGTTVNATTAGDQDQPEATTLANGQVVFTWIDDGPSQDASAVIARVFNADGSAATAELIVNDPAADPAHQELSAQVAALAEGGFVVTWNTLHYEGSDSLGTIRAQVFDADGAKAGPQIHVNEFGVDDGQLPAVTALATGGFVIAWESGTGSSDTEIKARIFDSDGSPAEQAIYTNRTAYLQPSQFLANDTDADGDAIRILGVETTSALGAQVTLMLDGSIRYEPSADMNADIPPGSTDIDSFDYTVDDGHGNIASASISLQVRAPLHEYTIECDDAFESDNTLTVTITRSGDTDLPGDTEVSIIFDDRSAVAGEHYLAPEIPPFRFSVGETERSFEVTIPDDGLDEPDRQFVVRLQDEADGTEIASRTVSILDDDSAPETENDYLASIDFGDSWIVNTEKDDYQTDPAIAVLSDGSLALAWTTEDETQDGTDQAVKMRIVDRFGTEVTPEFRVNTIGDRVEWKPFLLPLENGNVLVLWEARGGGVLTKVKGRVFGPDGTEVVPEFEAGDPDFSSSGAEALQNADGSILVTFERYAVPVHDIAVRLFTEGMEPSSTIASLPDDPVPSQDDVVVARLADGGFVFAWREYDEDGNTDIVVKLATADYRDRGEEFIANSERLGDQDKADVVGLANGMFVVTWETDDPAQDGDGTAVKARIFNADGTEAVAEFLVNTNEATGTQTRPVLAALPDGRFVVAWSPQVLTSFSSEGTITARIINPDGTDSVAPFLVGAPGPGASDRRPDIAILPDGRIAFTWTSYEGQDDMLDIRTRVFNADGTPASTGFYGDTPTELPASELLGNDSDADGDPLTISWVSGTTTMGGTIELTPDQILRYTPPSNMAELPAGRIVQDTFAYRVVDIHGNESTSAFAVIDVTGARTPIPTDADLEIGTMNMNTYGHRFDDNMTPDGDLTFAFEGGWQDLTFAVTGFDIDYADEVEVLLNGESIGFLTPGPDNGYSTSRFDISAGQQFLGQNVLTFRQAIDTGFIWGVTELMLASYTHRALFPGVTDTASFGNRYDGTLSPDGEVSFAFLGGWQDLALQLDGFDIDYDDEVEVFLNGKSLGFLQAGPDGGLATSTFDIPASEQVSGQNLLTFVQSIDRGYMWGLTNIRLDTRGPALLLGKSDTGIYGNRYETASAPDGNVDFSFEGTQHSLKLSVEGYDIDFADEVEIFLNGDSLGFLEVGPNNGLATTEIFIPASRQMTGENIITFSQAIDASYAWGVTNLLLEPCNTPPRAMNDALSLRSDGIGIIDVLGNDTDADGDVLQVLSIAGSPAKIGKEVTLASGAVVTLLADGRIAYDPAGAHAPAYGETASDSFSYTLDDRCDVSTATVEITVEGPPDATLILGETDTTAYGNNFEGQSDADGILHFEFEADGQDLQLDLTGYDIDFQNEVMVQLNGITLGFLEVGPNLGLVKSNFVIPEIVVVDGTNVLSVIQALDPGYMWGVTNLRVMNHVDANLQLGVTDTTSYGNRFDDTDEGDGTLHFSFNGGDRALRLDLNGYDIDYADEVEVLLNGDSLGFLEVGPDADLQASRFDIGVSQQLPGDNIISFVQARNPEFMWGVTDLSLEYLSDASLVRGVVETDEFGHRFSGQNTPGGQVSFDFDGTDNDLVLDVDGFDIDYADEVEVLLNGDFLGFLEQGPDNQLQGTRLVIPVAAQQEGPNVVTFVQNLDPTFVWGVTNLALSTDVDASLVRGQTESGVFGNNFSGQTEPDGDLLFAFEGTDEELSLSVQGYDVDYMDEVEVLLNGQSIGFLDITPNNGLGESAIQIAPELQVEGENLLTFHQTLDDAYAWGVTELLLS